MIAIELKENTTHEFTFRAEAGAEETAIKVTFNWEGVTAADIQDWALSNRVIALQRQLRLLSQESLDELNGTLTVNVLNAGKKIQTRAEVLDAAKKMLASMPEDVRAEILKTLGA